MCPLARGPLSMAGLTLLSLCALFGCFARPAPLRVRLIDCALVRSDGLCEVGADRQVRLWLDEPGDVVVSQDGRELAVSPSQSGSRLLNVVLNPGVRSLEVEVTQGRWTRRARLPVREWAQPQWRTPARQHLAKGQLDEAEKLLREQERATSLEVRALAVGDLATLHKLRFALGAAYQGLTAAIRLDREAGLASQELLHRLELSMMLLTHFGRLPEAEAWLQGVEPLTRLQPEALPWLRIHTAQLLILRGQHKSARNVIAQGQREAEEFGQREARADLQQLESEVLHTLGWPAAAEARLEALVPQFNDMPCWQGYIRANQGQGRLQALDARPPGERAGLSDPRGPLLQALLLFATECPQRPQRVVVALQLARAAVLTERWEEAKRWLQRAEDALLPEDPTPPPPQVPRLTLGARCLRSPRPVAEHAVDPLLLLDLCDLRGEVVSGLARLGAQGASLPAEDLARYDEQIALAKKSEVREPQWTAVLGRARAKRAAASALKGDALKDAEHDFQTAERLLDDWSFELPLGGGRGSFLGRYERATGEHAALLVQMGREQEALRVVRHARRRALRSVLVLGNVKQLPVAQVQPFQRALEGYHARLAQLADAQRRYERASVVDRSALLAQVEQSGLARDHELDEVTRILSAGEPSSALSEPGEAEALLTCYPVSQRWLCLLAQGGGGVSAVELPSLEASGDALSPSRELLAFVSRGFTEKPTLKRLRVIPYGPLHRLALELTLPALGGAARRVPIEYSLDLPPSAATPPRSQRGYLLWDPRHEWHLSKEGREVAQQLSSPSLTLLAPAIGVGPQSLKAQLALLSSGLDLFLYLGHGEVDPMRPWGKRLLVDHDAELDIGQIATLGTAPRLVLLLSCLAGASDEERGIESLGLASAFLVGGAERVIASTEEVPVRLAAALAGALVQPGAEALLQDPANRLEEARAAVLKESASELVQDAQRASLRTFRVYAR